MREPKEFPLKMPDGTDKVFTLSKFPAIAGREIVAQYPTSGMPKIGDYSLNQALMLKLMAFVFIDSGGNPIALSTEKLIDLHTQDWETLAKIEWAMMEYNCSFFENGKASSFLGDLAEKLPKLVLSMLTPLLERSSENDSPPSTNSEPSTH